MTSADSSLLGLARQTAKGSQNTTDASFKYLLFNEGGVGPQERLLPLDQEVGGGALLRDVAQVGISTTGKIAFIPRPSTLGDMLYSVMGNVSTNGVVLPTFASSTTTISTGFIQPTNPTQLLITCSISNSLTFVVTGTDASGAVLGPESVVFTAQTSKPTVGAFRTITSLGVTTGAGNVTVTSWGTVLSKTLMDGSTVSAGSPSLMSPIEPRVLSMAASGATTAGVTINGLATDGATTEAVTLNGGTFVSTVKTWKIITSIVLPPVSTTYLTINTGGSAMTANRHIFTLGSDQFAAPYYTFRTSTGNMWGEQFMDCRVNSFALAWRGANFVRAQAELVGGLPSKVASMSTWAASTKVDGGPQFLGPVSNISVPTSTALKILSGSFSVASSIPMDEQWIVGSYSPDAFDIVQKSFNVSLVVKVVDSTLYTKAMYDPAAGNAWVTAMMKEANLDINFRTGAEAASGAPYVLNISANGQSYASGSANVIWNAQTISLKPGKQVTMVLNGTFIADPTDGEPVTISLVNKTASY